MLGPIAIPERIERILDAHVLSTYAHVLPGFRTLSDSFVSEPHTHVNWFSWVTAVLEIITGIVFGVAGARALRAAE